jgi:hypothetical protein
MSNLLGNRAPITKKRQAEKLNQSEVLNQMEEDSVIEDFFHFPSRSIHLVYFSSSDSLDSGDGKKQEKSNPSIPLYHPTTPFHGQRLFLLQLIKDL